MRGRWLRFRSVSVFYQREFTRNINWNLYRGVKSCSNKLCNTREIPMQFQLFVLPLETTNDFQIFCWKNTCVCVCLGLCVYFQQTELVVFFFFLFAKPFFPRKNLHSFSKLFIFITWRQSVWKTLTFYVTNFSQRHKFEKDENFSKISRSVAWEVFRFQADWKFSCLCILFLAKIFRDHPWKN